MLFDSESSHQAFSQAVAPALQAGQDVHIEWEFARKDGSRFVALVSGQAIQLPGHARAAVWVYEDIAARSSAWKTSCAKVSSVCARYWKTAPPG